MGAAQIKEELYQFMEEGDARLIKMLYAVAKEYSSEDNELSTSLDRSLQQVKEGKVTPHSEVRKKYAKWL
jgi:hypothetical protein